LLPCELCIRQDMDTAKERSQVLFKKCHASLGMPLGMNQEGQVVDRGNGGHIAGQGNDVGLVVEIVAAFVEAFSQAVGQVSLMESAQRTEGFLPERLPPG